MKLFITLILLTSSIITSTAQNAQQYIAATPPMGWNHWNQVGHRINEQIVKEAIDAIVSKGLRDVGYNYIVIDDSWEKGRVKLPYLPDMVEVTGRDEKGRLICNPVTFPSGIKFLADYAHSKGLKFGIYTTPGYGTCGGCTGSLGYEAIDLKTFADWGVDYIKLDGCSSREDPEIVLHRWRNLIDSIGRPIVLSINVSHDFELTRKYADMWRTTWDIMPIWKYRPEQFRTQESIFGIIQLQVGLEQFHGNGHWNDPDMLQIGNGKLTYNENKSHFGMWCILGAPLMLGTNLAQLSDSIRNIVSNPEAIAINQDPAGVMGTKLVEDIPGVQIWAKRLWKIGDLAVAFLNATDSIRDISINLSDLGISGQAFFRDAFNRRDLGIYSNKFSVRLEKDEILLAKVSSFEPIKAFSPYAIRPLEFKGNSIRLEAENQNYDFSRTDVKKYKGFSGNGYIIGENHMWGRLRCSFSFGLKEEGYYKVKVRYINFDDKDLIYNINNQEVTLKPTKSTNPKWEDVNLSIRLKGGNNKINIIAPNFTSNRVAIDYIEIAQ